jgi:hypothetical protein
MLRVTTWSDPVIDRLGHDPRSTYVERFWTSVLGPSTTLLLRRLAAGLDERPAGFDIDLDETAKALGLGIRSGRNAPFLRAIRRSCTFGLARYQNRTTLAVRRRVPPLNRGQVLRLPEALQAEHRLWIEHPPTRPSPAELRERARRLALSLAELGEDAESIERHLHRWRFHPAMAHEAMMWACAQRDVVASAGLPDVGSGTEPHPGAA